VEGRPAVRLIAVGFNLVLSQLIGGAALEKYENKECSFAIHFPVDPAAETASHQAEADAMHFQQSLDLT
jgi:hypothetical protein